MPNSVIDIQVPPIRVRQDPEGPHTMSQNLKALPMGQICVAIFLIVPCLAIIFANTFVLFIPWSPPPPPQTTVNQTIAATTALPEITTTSLSPIDNVTTTAKLRPQPKFVIMKRTVFTDFEADEPTKANKHKSQQIKLLFLVFNGAGSIVAGFLSDTYGRRITCVCFFTLTVLASLLSTASSSLLVFEVLWSMVAFGLMGSHISNLVRVLEMLPDRLRTATWLVMNGAFWGIARLLAIFFAFAFRDWHMLVFFLSFCVCLFLLLAHLRPSSIREVPRPGPEAKNDRLHHIFTHKNLWPRTAACAFGFFVTGLIFYGFNLSRKVFLTRSIYANMAITGVIDFSSSVLAAATCHSTRRTLPCFMVFMFFNGLCCLIMAPFEACSSEVGWEACSRPHKTVVFMSHFSSIFTAGCGLNILWLATFSAFPKKIRAFGVGVCSSAGRLGAILGIQLVDAGLVYGSVTALVIVGILAWTAGLTLLLSLPERAFKPLFDNADQDDDDDGVGGRRDDVEDVGSEKHDHGGGGGGSGDGSIATVVSYNSRSEDSSDTNGERH